MATREVKTIDLTAITDANAIGFNGQHSDGRVVSVTVDVFATSHGVAYGALGFYEEGRSGSSLGSFNPFTHVVRLPLEGELTKDSEIDLQIADSEGIDYPPSAETVEGLAWSSFHVAYEGLQLTRRG